LRAPADLSSLSPSRHYGNFQLETLVYREIGMLKIVNQTTYEFKYYVGIRNPTSSDPVGSGTLAPGHIAAYRIDNTPGNNKDALNCLVQTSRTVADRTIWLDSIYVPGNATVVFSTQIVTGPLLPAS
jgi:hypothetical protein